MPKMKTNRSAAKRYELTGSGKLRRKRAGKNHLNEHKSSKRLRTLTGKAVVPDCELYKVMRQCPYPQALKH